MHSNWKWSFILHEWSSHEKRYWLVKGEKAGESPPPPSQPRVGPLLASRGLPSWTRAFLSWDLQGKSSHEYFFIRGEATLFYHIFPFSEFSGDAGELENDFNWKWLYLVPSCSCEWFYCRWIISNGCITQIKSSSSCPRKPASVQRHINKKH